MLLLLLPLLLGSAFLSTGTSADPFSPFNRNKAHQDNYHPSGISFGPPPPPQRFSEALRNHPSLDQQPQSDGKFDVVYQWRIMDFEFPSAEARRRALASGEFIPENNLPLGVDIFRNRLFLTLPRWKDGVPYSLAWLPYPPTEESPRVRVYPSWDAHSPVRNPDCNRLMSVYRLAIDECDRLWIIDSGVVNATILPNPVCPPKIVVVDLNTDQVILTHQIPQELVREGSLHTNIVVDIRNGQCRDAHAYVTDVWRNGILVFSLAKMRSWRTSNHLYLPNPHASDYTLHGLNFQWTDGVFGLSLPPVDEYGDRALFFRPMSSFNEFVVDTAILRNESAWQGYWGAAPTAFQQLPGNRGPMGQSSSVGIDRNGVQWFPLVIQDAIACWDIRKPYDAMNIGIVEQNTTTLVFPNDLKVDNEVEQGVWVVANRLPFYLYSTLDYNQINFRILRTSAAQAIRGTVCDPSQGPGTNYLHQ